MTTIHRHLAIVTATLVALAACSGSDAAPAPLDTEAPTTTVEADETSVPETAIESTTTEPTTTEPAATILVTSTIAPPETTTTAPPATDPPSDADLVAEIEADLNDNEQAFLAAGADPGSPESIAVIEERYAGEAQTNFGTFFAELADSGLKVRANPDQPSFVRVLEVLEATDESALVRACRIDAGVVYRPADDEFPDILIINDGVFRYVNEITVLFDGVRWRSAGGTSIDSTQIDSSDETACDGF